MCKEINVIVDRYMEKEDKVGFPRNPIVKLEFK